MQHKTHVRNGTVVQSAMFASPSGAKEVHLTVTLTECSSFEQQLEHAQAAYREALIELELLPSSCVLRRIYASDPSNQLAAAERCQFMREPEDRPFSVSLVGQPPLPSSKLAVWAYHVSASGPIEKRELAPNVVELVRPERRHVFLTNIGGVRGGTAAEQTRAAFNTLCEHLSPLGGTLAEHVVRTWIHVRDVDTNYASMIGARREAFERHGLVPETHFIASTGIEGCSAAPDQLVSLDAYAVLGLDPDQVRFLGAPDHLGPACRYGATFERGVRVAYGDRAHILISGTASIDAAGRTLHEGDVKRQLRRTRQNIEALLDDAGASLSDVAQRIVYLRDLADYPTVSAELAVAWPSAPTVFVLAPVCRPQWLVEVECIAIRANYDPRFPPF